MRTIEYKIPPDRDGAAVGRFLRGDCGLSRRLIASLKHRPLGITANGIHIRTVDNLRAGDVLAIRLEGRDSSARPTDIPLHVLYEDDDLIVIDKPAYMPIHPTHGHITDTLANAYAAHARKKGEPTSFHPIGRLDRNTTGLVVGCKNRHAANLLQNRVKKTYLAVCEGALTGGGTVDAPIRRKDGHGVRREVGEGGLPCVTHWRAVKLDAQNNITLAEVWLETGRTHQIRTHFAESLKAPLCGDDMYGGRTDMIARHALHCAGVLFNHPITKQPMSFRSGLPDDMGKCFSEKLYLCDHFLDGGADGVGDEGGDNRLGDAAEKNG